MPYNPYESIAWDLPTQVDSNPLIDVSLPLCIRTLLARRGFENSSVANKFIIPDVLPDPNIHFPDLFIAINRLRNACKTNEKVAICGDYDADGMTSTALLVKVLNTLGANPRPAIPNRIKEGYGLNEDMIEQLYNEGINLLITVDNGVSAKKAILKAKKYLMDIIITDHHLIPKDLPQVHALLHPETTPLNSPYRNLAGVGLAYILASTIASEFNSEKALNIAKDFFCIGTIADMTPLLGANRTLLIDGLKGLRHSDCKGLKALINLSGLEGKDITADDIGFKIAPRINAVGRLSDPKLIIDLLLEENEEKATLLAINCNDLNNKRRELCEGIEAEATALIESDSGNLPSFIMLVHNHWHPGVIGIVASRIVEKYSRPTALLVGDGKGNLRASVRAPYGFNVIKALTSCGSYFNNYGGHAAAGGFTIEASSFVHIQKNLNKLAEEWQSNHPLSNIIKPEIHLPFNEIDQELWNSIHLLEPFGVGNSKPLFWTKGCTIKDIDLIKGRYRKILLEHNQIILTGMDWYNNIYFEKNQKIDIAYHIYKSYWNNNDRIELEIKAIRISSVNVTIKLANRLYKCSNLGNGKLSITNQKGDIMIIDDNSPSITVNIKSNEAKQYLDALIISARTALGLCY